MTKALRRHAKPLLVLALLSFVAAACHHPHHYPPGQVKKELAPGQVKKELAPGQKKKKLY